MAKDKIPDEISLCCLKKLSSIAQRMPRQKSKGRGVDPGTMQQHIDNKRLDLGPALLVDGVKHYYIPPEDLLKPDWGLQEKYKPKKLGRPSRQERLGF